MAPWRFKEALLETSYQCIMLALLFGLYHTEVSSVICGSSQTPYFPIHCERVISIPWQLCSMINYQSQSAGQEIMCAYCDWTWLFPIMYGALSLPVFHAPLLSYDFIVIQQYAHKYARQVNSNWYYLIASGAPQPRTCEPPAVLNGNVVTSASSPDHFLGTVRKPWRIEENNLFN